MLEVKNIYDALQTKVFSTFCDVYSLGSGEFNQDLITAIDNCTNFILILGAHSMERCSDDEDWLYCEIKEALEKKKNIKSEYSLTMCNYRMNCKRILIISDFKMV